MCGEPDEYQHRFTQCVKTQAARDIFPEVIEACLPDNALWRCPVSYRHGDADALSILCYMQTEPKISEEILGSISWRLPLEVCTDGSGLYQTCPEAHLSGWAIVIVQFPSDARKRAAIDNFVRNRTIPPQFQVALA